MNNETNTNIDPAAKGSSIPPSGHSEWDERYSKADQVWSGKVNGALVKEAADLPPGHALDVGCGEGADAVWLAMRGWKVTALDVSDVALHRAQSTAKEAGVDIHWMHAGLLDAPLRAGGYNLVSVQYPALLRSPGNDSGNALLAAVAPGGILLVVHHADIDVDVTKAHGFDPADYVSHEDIVTLLGDGWHIEIAEQRPRELHGGGGHHKDDLILKARRNNA